MTLSDAKVVTLKSTVRIAHLRHKRTPLSQEQTPKEPCRTNATHRRYSAMQRPQYVDASSSRYILHTAVRHRR